MDHIHFLKILAGLAGLEPTKCQSQSLVPYRLGYSPVYKPVNLALLINKIYPKLKGFYKWGG